MSAAITSETVEPPGLKAASVATITNADSPGASAVPEGYKVMKEGMASILMKGNDVFYNEAQVVNRDLSTAVLRHFLPMLAKEREAALAAAQAKGGFVKGAWRAKQQAAKDLAAKENEATLKVEVGEAAIVTGDMKSSAAASSPSIAKVGDEGASSSSEPEKVRVPPLRQLPRDLIQNIFLCFSDLKMLSTSFRLFL